MCQTGLLLLTKIIIISFTLLLLIIIICVCCNPNHKMTSLFPEDLADPWSDSSTPIPKVSSSVSVLPQPSLASPSQHINNIDDDNTNDYLQELIDQNEELSAITKSIKNISVPPIYQELYNDNIRSDGMVDFLAIESVFEKAGLNQISIENILNLITMNQQVDFTTVDITLWNVMIGLTALEQQKLGAGNFQNLEAHIYNLPDLVLEKPGSSSNPITGSVSGSVWSENPTILNDPGASQQSTGAKLRKTLMVDGQNIRREFNPNTNDVIDVSEIAEKEGLVFKHINYLVSHSIDLSASHPADAKKVVRRYSDFVWLYETLLKKYPFRMVPGLPPKRFSGPNTDPLFLERRKRGLSRFLNIVMKHPVLSKEAIVIMFLTIPAELSVWRKQTPLEILEEFEGKRISKRFIDSWDNNHENVWEDAENSLIGIQNNWAKITLLVERFEKRKQLYNTDNQKFIEVLGEFIKTTNKVYSVEPSDISPINVGIKSMSTHIKTSAALLKDESQLIEDGILKEFKEYNEYLTSLYGLFERRKRLGGNNIHEIKKKVEQSQGKLGQLKKKSDVKGSEVDNLVQTINNDKQLVIRQTNRDWLIKECVQQEFLMFQETQYKITKVFQEWVSDRLKYSELHSENWSQLADALQAMPANNM
ncbi:Mvp1 protein [Saccharomycopsis crataegensis]|uniref:Sorting nexin MVP1 n=1 Tax=Saccharomycopsis crataegensis TaxID=43959 RepID=A0AAV5QW90_9ASCO|nr:Mvp1 protein [Saccharomycopsis crataegensis]